MGASAAGGAGVAMAAKDSTFSCTGGAAIGATAGAAALGTLTTTGGCSAGFCCPAVVATCGFTTAVGGTTVTTGRAVTAPAGALATTGPAGGFEAIAGCEGGTMAGAGRGCGTILRGSGLAGAAGGAATATTGGAGLAVSFGVTVDALLGGTWLLRASASCSCFLARMAFITSPGLDTCDRSIFGVMACAPREPEPEWPAERAPCWKCARTFSAS